MLLILAVTAMNGAAQNFSLSPGKVHSQTLNINDQTYDGITFTNITNIKLTLNWTLIEMDTLADSYFTMCSSGFCWLGMPKAGSFPSIDTGQTGWLFLHSYSGNITGTNTIRYLVDDGNSQYDTLTFFIHVVNMTGVEKNTSSDALKIISATGEPELRLLIKEGATAGATLSVTSLTGSTLLKRAAVKGENRISLDPISSGIYFITYSSSEGSFTKKFVKP